MTDVKKAGVTYSDFFQIASGQFLNYSQNYTWIKLDLNLESIGWKIYQIR